MPLGPRTKAFFEKLEADLEDKPIKSLKEISIEEFRKECHASFDKLATELPPGVKSNDFFNHILHLDNQINLPIQVYTPSSLDHGQSAPCLIYFPAGGFCLSLNTYQAACAIIANQANCKVFIIHYPLAPEYSAQEITDICYKAVKHLYENYELFNIDKKNFIVAGCSSGATLAAVVTNRSLNDVELNIHQQILVTPWVDLSLEIHENNPYLEYQKQDIMLTDEALEYFANIYVSDPMKRKLPYVSPIFCKYLSGIPDTVIIVGEYDGLRGDGTCYSEALQQAGNNNVELIICEGQTHNFMACRKVLDDGDDPAVLVADAIKRKLI